MTFFIGKLEKRGTSARTRRPKQFGLVREMSPFRVMKQVRAQRG